MKIVSAQIALQGERSARQYYRAHESLQLSRSGVRYSGVFLYEDSRIGSLQQIDLVA